MGCDRSAWKSPRRVRATSIVLTILIASVCSVGRAASVHAQEAPRFRAGVTVVPITAVVRDSRGRLVRDLARDDFEVLENGRPRPIVDFRATGHTPISLALLFDTSGSMGEANLDRGKAVVEALLNRMETAWDEMALFTFDKSLRGETPFTNDADVIRTALGKTVAWGQTSLYDAIAEAAKRLGDRRTQRRAVVVITDGVDTSSTITPEKVSELASALEVPVYVLTVAPPRRRFFGGDDTLADLAIRTGGVHVRAHLTEDLDTTISTMLAELRQLYFLAIDSATTAGSYRLEVRTKRKGLKVRARSGYVATH